MISEKEQTRISKLLSLALRHKPEALGIELDANGWTDVDVLIGKINETGIPLNMQILRYVVDNNSKRRFAFNDSFQKIRASQGHSVEIELGYTVQRPPDILYHGTGEKSVNQIREEGLRRGQRQHVHLSADIGTATTVGQRHGKPFVFEVMAGLMFADKYDFFLSDNGVWLTESVPVKYLRGDLLNGRRG